MNPGTALKVIAASPAAPAAEGATAMGDGLDRCGRKDFQGFKQQKAQLGELIA
jgi:hypothetical protein